MMKNNKESVISIRVDRGLENVFMSYCEDSNLKKSAAGRVLLKKALIHVATEIAFNRHVEATRG